MKKFYFLLAALALLAGQGRGPGQVPGLAQAQLYELTPAVGPWMIFIMDYHGTNAQDMAVKLVQELRSTYKLPAYLFNFADQERAKERERIQKLREQQRNFLIQNGADPSTPIRIRTRRFEDQCGVLIGGFKDREAALKELKRIRTLNPPDQKSVPLPNKLFIDVKKQEQVLVPVNPFARAFVVPNPTVKQTPVEDRNKPDPLLKTLNGGETYNLLKCPRKFTLAVAQFHGASTVETAHSGTSKILGNLGRSGQGDTLSGSAMNAHNLAEFLHTKLNFEAYVLHTRYYSVVAIGGFDNLDDPRIGAIKNQLASLQLNRQPLLNMLPEPQPMLIPRP